MRYRARLRDAKNPKRTVNISLVAKSKKEAEKLLKKYVPGLAPSNPREQGHSAKGVVWQIRGPKGTALGRPFKATRARAEQIARRRVAGVKGKSGYYTGGYSLFRFGSTRATAKNL